MHGIDLHEQVVALLEIVMMPSSSSRLIFIEKISKLNYVPKCSKKEAELEIYANLIGDSAFPFHPRWMKPTGEELAKIFQRNNSQPQGTGEIETVKQIKATNFDGRLFKKQLKSESQAKPMDMMKLQPEKRNL